MAFFKKIKHQNIQEEFDESQCNKLTQSFMDEKFKDAVMKAEQFFLKSYKGTYEQFINEVKSTQKTNCCLTSWNTPTLSGVCLDCQTTSSSFCIPCFLAQHHEQHNSFVKYYDSGSCDCGDSAFIKPSGFCPNHPGPDPNPDLTQMTPENRKKFITVFRAAFTAVFLYSPYAKSNKEKSKSERYKRPHKLIEYIKGFVPYGDGMRRCVSYAILPLIKKRFFTKFESATLTAEIVNLFGLLISDIYFRDRMSVISFRECDRLFLQMSTCISNDRMDTALYNSLHAYFSFTYHFFTEHSILYAINKESFEWPDFLSSFLASIYSPIELTNFNYDVLIEQGIFDHFDHVHKFLKTVMKYDDQHSNIQKFIDSYSKFLCRIERQIKFLVALSPQDEYDDGYVAYQVTLSLSYINSCFFPNSKDSSPANTTFSLNKTFELLVDYLERADIKPQSILNAQERCPISTVILLHTLFYALLSGQKNPKEVLKSLCQKRKYVYDYFCSIVITCPLRVIAALFSFSKFTKVNNGHKLSIKLMLKNSEITFNSMFGLIQLILSICDDKSKLMNAILTTFGVFDDISLYKIHGHDYDRQKHLFEDAHFDCSIFLLSLLTDNSVQSFNPIKFKRLRVIELLKRKKATASDIENYANEKLCDTVFADELVDYIERVTSKKGGSYFRLKSDADFNPFFPAIQQMDRIELLSKYTDRLVPLSEFIENPDRGMSLKECFKTPEFFCLCFKVLSSPNLNLAMKQVGLAMCNCFIKNTEKFPPQSYKDDGKISIAVSSLKELIKDVKENDNLKNANWLTASLQYSSDEQSKATLMKLILMQENLGKMLIETTGLPTDLDQNEVSKKQQEEKDRIDQLIKEKKAKAALLKQRLMKDFKNRRNQFNNLSSSDIKIDEKKDEDTKPPNQTTSTTASTEDESDSLDPNEQMLTDEFNKPLCNICHSPQDDIFGVPCLSLPSIIPSLINDKVHQLNTPIDKHDCVYSMSICPHQLHYKCYVQILSEAVKQDPSTKLYHCMMDRGTRNCFLPIFEGGNEQFTEQPPVIMRVAINDFIRRAFDEKASSNLLLPLRSFCAAVQVLEVRLRTKPDALDSPKVPLLLRNLLLTIYHGLHEMVAKSNDDCKDDPLLRLVYEIVKSEDPCNDFDSKVKLAIQSMDKKESSSYVYEFLRRSVIIHDIVFNQDFKSDALIDWDEVLSKKNLINRFDLKTSDFHKLKKFKTIKLPKKFISLYLKPYSIDICDHSVEKALDLFTGQVVLVEESDSVDQSKYRFIDDYERDVYKGGLAMYLVLTKSRASSILFHSTEIGKSFLNDSFYVDQFGDTDHGFKRGLITKLSKDNLENAVDKFASGEIILYN